MIRLTLPSTMPELQGSRANRRRAERRLGGEAELELLGDRADQLEFRLAPLERRPPPR